MMLGAHLALLVVQPLNRSRIPVTSVYNSAF